jgi:hypothetical protein
VPADSSLAGAGEVDNWLNTFNTFDRDGAGDINHHEIGLLFLQLGFRPTDAEIRALVSEVDNDSSGTVDFEEFCLLMLRLKRQPHIPDWLRKFFFPTGEGEVAPQVAVLSQAHKRNGVEGVAGQCPPLSRDMFFYVTDLLPLCDTLLTLKLSGFGDAFGPFLAEELAIGLGRSNRTLKTLELAYNSIGDAGAEAFARALSRNFTLTSLDVAGNGIGVKGAQALLDSIPAPPLPAPPATDRQNRESSRKPSRKSKAAKLPQRSSLRALNLEDNDLPPTLLADVGSRLVLLELPRTFALQLEAPPPPPPPLAAAHAVLAALTLGGLAADAVVGSVAPAVTVSNAALCGAHTASLHAHALHHRIASLALIDCGAMGEAGGKALFLASGDGAAAGEQSAFKGAKASLLTKPPVTMLHQQLSHLRISACGLGNEAASAFADFVRRGCVPALASLALDGNQITMQLEPAAGAALPPRLSLGQEQGGPPQLSLVLAGALLTLPRLTDVDLSANPLADADAAIFCHALLSSASLHLLHLAGTFAGDACAAACAEALDSRTREGGQPSQLRVLSLSGDVGDAGAARLATALPACANLRELWLGGCITDEGAGLIARCLREPATRLRSLSLGGTTRGGVAIRNPRLTARATDAFADTLCLPNGCLEMLRLSGNASIGGGGCVHLLQSLQASSSLRALHVDGCGLNKVDVGLLIEALQASVWCLHELRLEYDMPGTFVPGMSPRSPRDAPGGKGGEGGEGGEASPAGGKPVLQREGKKLLSLQNRLLLAKLLEDNRLLGRRRVDQFKLGRSLEEVAHVFNHYCANINQASVDAGLDAWRGVDCAQFVRNVGLPQYDVTFERNLSGAKLQWLQMSQMSQLGVASFAHQKEVMKAVRLLVHAYARKEQVAHTMGQWDIVLGRKQAKKERRRQQTQEVARESARLRADGAAVRRAERAHPRPRTAETLEGVEMPHVPPSPGRSPPLGPGGAALVGRRAEGGRAGTSPSGSPRPRGPYVSAPAIVSMQRSPSALPSIPNKKAARDWVGFLSPFAGNFRNI